MNQSILDPFCTLVKTFLSSYLIIRIQNNLDVFAFRRRVCVLIFVFWTNATFLMWNRLYFEFGSVHLGTPIFQYPVLSSSFIKLWVRYKTTNHTSLKDRQSPQLFLYYLQLRLLNFVLLLDSISIFSVVDMIWSCIQLTVCQYKVL